MNEFAELLDRLAYEPSRNNKLRLIADYLRTTPDPERGYALAALTGALSFQHAKPGIIRALIAWLEGRADKPETRDLAPFRPAMLAHAIEETDFAALDPKEFTAEWKW